MSVLVPQQRLPCPSSAGIAGWGWPALTPTLTLTLNATHPLTLRRCAAPQVGHIEAQTGTLLRTTLLTREQLGQHASQVAMPAALGSLLGRLLAHLTRLAPGRYLLTHATRAGQVGCWRVSQPGAGQVGVARSTSGFKVLRAGLLPRGRCARQCGSQGQAHARLPAPCTAVSPPRACMLRRLGTCWRTCAECWSAGQPVDGCAHLQASAARSWLLAASTCASRPACPAGQPARCCMHSVHPELGQTKRPAHPAGHCQRVLQ